MAYPGSVVECLRHHIPRGLVPLQLDYYQVAFRINGKYVNRAAKRSNYLSTNYHEVMVNYGNVCRDDLLKFLFKVHPAKEHRT